jgi:Cu(I)/Ag(I) efflux system membrane fusion protein/cobalt-zinc-cadmium efflux system membrane fusion protein
MDKKMHNMDLINDSTHHMNDNNKMPGQKNSIVRSGVIDLKAIDKNKDGKVFQDMMDYNVISDKPGKCPLCGMKLKEVSLKKAKDTLLKSGYKVK